MKIFSPVILYIVTIIKIYIDIVCYFFETKGGGDSGLFKDRMILRDAFLPRDSEAYGEILQSFLPKGQLNFLAR